MFLQLSPFFAHHFEARDNSVRDDRLWGKLSVQHLAFLHRDYVELNNEKKVQSLPQKSHFSTISFQPSQFCHLHSCIELPSTRWGKSYYHDLRQNRVSFLLEDLHNNSPPVWENSLRQILISKNKAKHVFWGRGVAVWSFTCRTEGKKLASLGPFPYLGKIIPPIFTPVPVKEGNSIYYYW